MKTILILGVFLSITLFTGCFSPKPQMSQEEIQAQKEFRMQLMKQLSQKMQVGLNKNYGGEVQQRNSVNVKPKSFISNEELLNEYEQFPRNSSGVKFTKLKDGFTINGQRRYSDFEGRIVNFGYNWKNGNVCYLINTAPNRYKIKFNRVLTGKEAINIADINRVGNQYKITTVTGKKVVSEGLILTSTGFIALRDDSAYIYNIGKEIHTFYAPDGWHIARFQNGDVSSTNFILLERTKEQHDSDTNALFEFIEATKELASSIGLTKKQDYMLINLYDTNKKFLIDVSVGDKDVALYSQCKRTNKYIAKCDNVDFKEAIYQANGLPNTGHYYWTILWFSTPDGAIAVTRERTQSTVYLTDLITGKKVEAAFRLTGFPELSGEQDKNGKIKIIIGGGMLSNVEIHDANKFLTENPAVDNNITQAAN